jgi:hypothetical protein
MTEAMFSTPFSPGMRPSDSSFLPAREPCWDATIRLFAPEIEPTSIPAKRVRQSDLWFEQGELPRRALDALRRAGEPIRARDLVRAVMIDKGLDLFYYRSIY